ncbi:MAG: PDZ domain-containing protein, partial [bacterium]|nr:PDZ domain-containing protein [bacterium]
GLPGVVPDSPADRAGLKEGDLIVKVSGELFSSNATLAEVLNMYEPGDQVELEVLREGDIILSINVELGEFDETVLQ